MAKTVVVELKYKTYIIKFMEYNDKWHLYLAGEDIFQNESYQKVIAYADRLDKKAFEPIEAYLKNYNEGWIKVSITSITDDGYCWLKRPNGKREKQGARYLYEFSKHNEIIVKEIVNLEQQITKKQEDVSNLHDKLINIKLPKAAGE